MKDKSAAGCLAISAPRVWQVYTALRAQVTAMHPGVPLPPLSQVMEEMSVSQATVDKAYRQLASEGFIERKRRKGVFVADRRNTGEIAIVLSQILVAPPASPTYARMCARLRRCLLEVNPKWSVNLHLGVSDIPGPDMPRTLDLLEPTVLPRLRGVLSFHPLFEMGEKLQAAGVPVVNLGSSPGIGPRVWFDHEQVLRDGMRHLTECGCRSVCLLHAKYAGKKPVGTDPTPAAASAAAACGLEFRDEWIGYEEGGWSERHGYELFRRLWTHGKRPDGVLVPDDILCHGVLRAIQELGVELPRDLRLITQASRGFDFPYPRPVTRCEFDLDEATDKAVRMLEALAKGQTPENTVACVQATLVKGATT